LRHNGVHFNCVAFFECCCHVDLLIKQRRG
jgi:hypothetical protein